MVWPDSLEKTAHVWQTGRVARVTGRLQIRGDDFSISCYEAQEYQLPDNAPMTSAGEAVTASASKPAPVSPSAPARPTRSNGNRPAASQEAPASSNGHRDSGVLIRMVETDQPDEDRYRLRQAIRVMLEYTGDDKVYLELHLKEGRTVLMEIPTVSTAVCDELQQRVQGLLLQDETCTEYPAKAA
jgi:hypothetical protein